MKRFLSLTLVLAVVLSMFTITMPASAATFQADLIEDDFQGTLNTKVWRASGLKIGIAPIDSDAGNGNKSIGVGEKASATNLDLTGVNNPFNVSGRVILDYDYYMHSTDADYNSLVLLGNDGVTTTDGTALKTFETAGNGMLSYSKENKTLSIYKVGEWSEGKLKTSSSSPVGASAPIKSGEWNKIRVMVDTDEFTFRVMVNGKLLSDNSGKVDFLIPMSYTPVENGRFAITNVRHQIRKNQNLSVWFDNVSYRKNYNEISISSSSEILNGEQNAPVSALLEYEFTKDILPLTASDIVLKKGTSKVGIKEVKVNGNKLSIRLNSKLSYNSDYVLNLGSVITADGTYLPATEQLVSFKTKQGSRTSIIEEDFESGEFDSTIWRTPIGNNKVEINPVDSAAGNGNYSYKVYDKNFDMNTAIEANRQTLRLKDKIALDFKFLAYNVSGNYNALALKFIASDGKTIIETAGNGMFIYNAANNTFGVNAYYDENLNKNTTASGEGAPAAVELKKNEWNNVRVLIDMNTKTFSIIVNGTILANQFGNSEYKLPALSDVNQEYSLADVVLQQRKVDGIYFDDICYTNIVEAQESVSNITYNEGEAKVSITKNIVGSSLPKKVMLSVASYTSDNELVALATEDFTLSRGDAKEYSVKLNNFNGGTVQKVFLWSIDSGSITPIKAIK